MELNNNAGNRYWLAAQYHFNPTEWSIQEDKLFEENLGIYGTPNKWPLVVNRILGKTQSDAIHHYGELEEDVNQIEAGAFDAHLWRFDDAHKYTSSCPMLEEVGNNRVIDDACRKINENRDSSDKKTEKKVQHWTQDEHINFLKGLKQYPNQWKRISKEFVKSKTAVQVASHAQKFYKRQKETLEDNDKSKTRRKSIHDITLETLTSDRVKESLHTPTPPQNQTIGIPQEQQGRINHQNGISFRNVDVMEPLNSTFHAGSIGFNQNGHNMPDTSCYESYFFAPQQNDTSMSSPQELQEWVDDYDNGGVPMGFSSHAGNTFQPSSFGCSTDDQVLPPFP